MEFLKVVKNESIRVSSNIHITQEYDSHGYKARFKVTNGTVNIYCGRTGLYPLVEGEVFEFVGKITFFGTGEIQCILFDRI